MNSTVFEYLITERDVLKKIGRHYTDINAENANHRRRLNPGVEALPPSQIPDRTVDSITRHNRLDLLRSTNLGEALMDVEVTALPSVEAAKEFNPQSTWYNIMREVMGVNMDAVDHCHGYATPRLTCNRPITGAGQHSPLPDIM